MLKSKQIGKIFFFFAASGGLLILFLGLLLRTERISQSEINNFKTSQILINSSQKISAPINKSNKPANNFNAIEPEELKGFSETLPILMYHYIEKPSATTTLPGLYLDPIIFASQLEELVKNNYQTLFVSEAATDLRSERNTGIKNIVLTFDDGYEDFYTIAWPIIKKHNYKSTVYVIINRLDTRGYLTRAQVKELAASGLVEIGSHTFNHPDLRRLESKDAKFEIQASRKKLEEISGQPVLSFAYPFGYYQADFFDIASSTGYTSAVSVKSGVKQGTGNLWLLRRLRPGNRSGEIFSRWLEDWTKARY